MNTSKNDQNNGNSTGFLSFTKKQNILFKFKSEYRKFLKNQLFQSYGDWVNRFDWNRLNHFLYNSDISKMNLFKNALDQASLYANKAQQFVNDWTKEDRLKKNLTSCTYSDE